MLLQTLLFLYVTASLFLCVQTNALTAGLGVANIALYASIYTPLKQIHPINTWVGAVVGAVPPLMGWAAATGSIDPGAAFMAAVLYFWQLPHFMALAWLCKDDYARGGHRMLSLLDTTGSRTSGVALRNALYLVPLGFAAVSAGLVHPAFTYESVGLSFVLALSASVFYTTPTAQVRLCTPTAIMSTLRAHAFISGSYFCVQTARLLFRMSLMHLPLYMVLAVLHRIPNEDTLTWTQVINYMQRGTEAAEKRIYQEVHGTPSDALCGFMLFPFSPPLLMSSPCPYSLAKQSLGISTTGPPDSSEAVEELLQSQTRLAKVESSRANR